MAAKFHELAFTDSVRQAPQHYYGQSRPIRQGREWHDDSGHWFRFYDNENWEFTADGLMQRRYAIINDLPIRESDRNFSGPWDDVLMITPDFLT